jgi:thymidylate kinase
VTSAGGALEALTGAGVTVRPRKGATLDALPSDGEVDLEVPGPELARADAALRRSGYHRFDARGHPDHRFYLACHEGRWLKLDVKRAGSRVSPPRRWVALLAKWVPPSPRRTGPVVAFLGPDGAGKSTIIDELGTRIPIGVTVVRLGSLRRSEPAGRGGLRGPAPAAGPARELAFVAVKAARTWMAIARAYAAAWRGRVVLCDRHPLELRVVRPARRRLAGTIERLSLVRTIPRPDAIVLLDAPTEALLARKPEHPAETVDRWRNAYRERFAEPDVAVVATDGSVERTVDRASRVVWEALRSRRRW